MLHFKLESNILCVPKIPPANENLEQVHFRYTQQSAVVICFLVDTLDGTENWTQQSDLNQASQSLTDCHIANKLGCTQYLFANSSEQFPCSDLILSVSVFDELCSCVNSWKVSQIRYWLPQLPFFWPNEVGPWLSTSCTCADVPNHSVCLHHQNMMCSRELSNGTTSDIIQTPSLANNMHHTIHDSLFSSNIREACHPTQSDQTITPTTLCFILISPLHKRK